jgi:hypothetical protein
LYPSDAFQEDTGSIGGTVTKDGVAIFGAHVVAFNTRTGTLVGGFTLNDRGEFGIAGLEPGSYVVRVEPLDDADVEAFFTRPVDVDFRASYAARVVVVPTGGASGAVNVAVRPK